jgi:GNAT superfamily N-acetyltransferase
VAGAPFQVEEVTWDDASARALRAAMAEEMGQRYADRVNVRPGVEADTVAYTVVVHTADRVAVGHAALRWVGADLELKRMFVAPAFRGAGVSRELLVAVEAAAARLGAQRIILQTGDRQPDAVRLYEKSGYTRVPIFAPYEAMTFSNCFEKVIGPAPAAGSRPDRTIESRFPSP